MEEVQLVAIFVAKILLNCGGVAFLMCFFFGAKLVWEMVKLAIYPHQLIYRWVNVRKLPVEALVEAVKS